MSLHETILSDLSAAMKQQDTEKLAVLRLIKAALLNVAKSGEQSAEYLSDDVIVSILTKEFKKRKEAAETYRSAQRADLAEKEEQEASVIEQYLPQQMTDEEIRSAVQEIIAQDGPGNFGAVMGKAMQQLKGKADGSRVKKCVEECIKNG